MIAVVKVPLIDALGQLFPRVNQGRFRKDSAPDLLRRRLLHMLRKSLHKSYKNCIKIPKQLRLKSPLHESLKLCFKIKPENVARNYPPSATYPLPVEQRFLFFAMI